MTVNRPKRPPARQEAQHRPNNLEHEQQAREALRESEEKYRLIFDNSPALHVIVGIDSTVQDANRTLLNTLGYSKDDVVGKNVLDFVVPEDVENTATGLAKALGNEKASEVEVGVYARDRSVRTLLFPPMATVLHNRQGQVVGITVTGTDITDRKRMEETLRQSEERYRTLFQQSNDPIYIVARDGTLLDVNQAMCQLFGYSREEMLGMDIRKLYVNPAERTKFQNIIEKEGAVKDYELKLRNKDGSGLECLVTSTVWHDNDGSIAGYRGTMRDITNRKRMEDALQESERQLKVILESTADGVLAVNREGKVLLTNSRFAEMWRIPEELLQSKEDSRLLEYVLNQLDDPDAFLEKVRSLYESLDTTFDHISFKDGRAFERYSSPLLRNGQNAGRAWSFHDITERKRMEEMLRQSEARYRTILDETEDNYYEVDLAGNFTFVNEATCRTLGYCREELMEMNNRVYVAEEDTKAMYQDFHKVYLTGKPARSLSYRIVRKDGTIGTGELAVYPLHNERGETIGFRGIGRDITKRKQAEEERQQLEQKAQLASRLASVGELAAGIAHEINNPLTSVIGYAQLLSAEEDIPDNMKKDLKAIIEGANRVAGIVKRLLTFARQTKPQQTLVNVADLIATTLDLRAYHLRTNNIKVTTQFDPKLPIITADAGQLQQVFLNIIVNAETDMKRAHGKGKLLIKAEKRGKTIRISFEDNGPGIAEENLKKIYDPFFTTREVGEGTGLGLSICYGIIAEHRGKIWAESQPGKGATFIVELPIVTKSSQLKVAEPPEEKTQKAAKAKILVIDDELMILQLVSRMLTEEGYHVETAGSAASALQMINKKRYNLILLDIKMPGMDGIQLYKRLKKMTPSLAKRVMFITGDVMGPETEAFLSQTRAPYATKPFDARQLKKEIERLLAGG